MKTFVAVLLCAVMLATSACSTSWVKEAEVIVPLLAPAAIYAYQSAMSAQGMQPNEAIIAEINQDSGAMQTALTNYQAAADAAKPDALSQLAAAGAAFQSSLQAVFSTFHIKDQNRHNQIMELTGLALGELASLQALIPALQGKSSVPAPIRAVARGSSTVAHATVRVASANNVKPAGPPLSAKAFASAFNKAAGERVLP